MFANKEHTRFYVSNYSSGTALSSGVVTTELNGTSTQVRFLDSYGARLTSPITATSKFRISFKESASADYRISDIIDAATMSTPVKTSPATAYEKIDYIGYNGSTGELETPVANTDYIVRLVLKSNLKSTGDYPLVKVAAYRTASGTPGAYRSDFAAGLLKSLIYNFSREKEFEQFANFELLCDTGVDGAMGTSVDNVTFTNGSKVISASGTINDSTGGGVALAAGTWVRVGTAASAAVYKVVSINTTANTATLDVPYQGLTATIADTGLKVISAANAILVARTFGIKVSGVPRKFKEGEFKYQKADWSIQLNENFISTTVTNSVAANKGSGTYEEVSEMEYQFQGNEGFAARLGVPPIVPRKNVTYSAVTNTTQTAEWANATGSSPLHVVSYSGSYYLVTIDWYNNSTKNTVSFDAKSYKRVIIACANSETAANIMTMLGQ